MGKTGPTRLPKEILAARGARIRKDRYPDKTVMVASKGGNQIELKQAVQPPRHLTSGAKKHWEDVSRFLHENNLSHSIFNGSLELYCYYLDQFQQMEKVLKKEGRWYFVDTKYGEVRQIRPEVKMMDDAAKQVRSLAGEFGLTPSSYSQVKKPAADPQQGELWPSTQEG